MCIICLKPQGIDLPSDDEIKYMFDKNPHGAGFALQGDIRGDGVFRVEFHKGFMNVDDLLEALGPREKLKNLTVAIHCRIKTSGETDKFTTHPFPISSIYGDLRQTDGKGPVLFHNGVFSGLGGIINENSSDTQDFVAGVATRYLKNPHMPNKIAQTIIEKVAGDCRILILYPEKNFPILRFGRWYEHKGCFYSNMGYKSEYENKWGGYGTSNYSSNHSVRNSYREELDEWGCNVAEYAWPSEDDAWIRFTDTRWKNLKDSMKEIEERGGEKHCKFNATGSKDWIVDEDYKEIYTAAMRETAKLRQDEEEYLAETTANGRVYYENGSYIWFEDADALLEWCEKAEEISQYEYKYAGKIWLINIDTMEAFTEEGIREYYKSGEIGHVRRQLKKTGTYIEHDLEAKYGYPTDDDPDDARPLLGVPRDEDKYDEELMQDLRLKGLS